MQTYEPLIIERADGCWLVDIDGRRLLDGTSSLWCNVHGHNHPAINQAIIDQLGRAAHVTALGASHPPGIELARRLVDLSPRGLEHVFFSSDGASAIEVALKIAFQFWQQTDPPRPQRTRFIALGQAYHGDTIGGVSVGGIDQFHAMFRPLLFAALRAPTPDVYRRPPGVDRAAALDHYLGAVDALLNEHDDQVAAVIVEPLMQGAAGMIRHPTGYLAGLRRLTREHDTLLIADEVAVGMGRSGRMFACEHEDVAPDLLCLGKGLSGGYLPISATLATTEIWRAFLGPQHHERTLFHGHTFAANPLAAAAALASLDVFEHEQTLARLPPKAALLGEYLARLADHPNVGDVRQLGMMAGIELVADKATAMPLPAASQRGRRVCARAIERGVWLRPLGDVIVVMPPLAISEADLRLLGDVLAQAIAEEFADP
jgi:adenosylmethionine-8-amino-7-oxononanoate aminotransferase